MRRIFLRRIVLVPELKFFLNRLMRSVAGSKTFTVAVLTLTLTPSKPSDDSLSRDEIAIMVPRITLKKF